MAPKIINLAEIDPNEVEFVVRAEDGTDHKMKPMSVKGYIELLKDAKKLEENPDPQEEINYLVRLIHRSFPTFAEDEIRELPLVHLHKIFEAIQEYGAANKSEGNDKTKNPPKATS